jgi:hypothetical protein
VQHDLVITRTPADEIPVTCLYAFACGCPIPPIGEIDERGGAAEQRGAPDLLGLPMFAGVDGTR